MVRTLLLALAALFALTAGALAQSYQIQPGDTLDISVLEDPSLNRQVLVRPDGMVSLPLAGAVQAEGRSPEQVAAAIRSRLARDFVSPPNVTVALLSGAGASPKAGSLTFYAIGQVASPGRYDVEGPLDLLQALATIGGLSIYADWDEIQLRRRTAEGDKVMMFNYQDIEDGLVPVGAMQLVDGDVIVVPERGLFD